METGGAAGFSRRRGGEKNREIGGTGYKPAPLFFDGICGKRAGGGNMAAPFPTTVYDTVFYRIASRFFPGRLYERVVKYRLVGLYGVKSRFPDVFCP
jgi:hypothetical protein